MATRGPERQQSNSTVRERQEREKQVREKWEKNGNIYVDKEAFDECWADIQHWINIPALVAYGMRYGLVKGPEDNDSVVSPYFPLSQRKANLLGLASNCGEYGYFILYMCICDSIGENRHGHGDAVLKLEECAKRLNKLPPFISDEGRGEGDTDPAHPHTPPPPYPHTTPPSHPHPHSHSQPPQGQPSLNPSSRRDSPPQAQPLPRPKGPEPSDYTELINNKQEERCLLPEAKMGNSEGVGASRVGNTADVKKSAAVKGNVSGSENLRIRDITAEIAATTVSAKELGKQTLHETQQSVSATASNDYGRPALLVSSNLGTRGAEDVEVDEVGPTPRDSSQGQVLQRVKELVARGNIHTLFSTLGGTVDADLIPKDRCDDKESFINCICRFIVACLNSRGLKKFGVLLGGVCVDEDVEGGFRVPGLQLECKALSAVQQKFQQQIVRIVKVRSGCTTSDLSEEETTMCQFEIVHCSSASAATTSSKPVAMVTVQPSLDLCRDKVYECQTTNSSGRRNSNVFQRANGRTVPVGSDEIEKLQRSLNSVYEGCK